MWMPCLSNLKKGIEHLWNMKARNSLAITCRLLSSETLKTPWWSARMARSTSNLSPAPPTTPTHSRLVRERTEMGRWMRLRWYLACARCRRSRSTRTMSHKRTKIVSLISTQGRAPHRNGTEKIQMKRCRPHSWPQAPDVGSSSKARRPPWDSTAPLRTEKPASYSSRRSSRSDMMRSESRSKNLRNRRSKKAS